MLRLAVTVALLFAGSPGLAQSLYEQAEAAELAGDGRGAVTLYVKAARSGDAKAARRLADIYEKGLPGISPDSAESRKWDNAARVLGERMQGDFPDRKRGY